MPDHPFPKYKCLIAGGSMLAGIDNNQLKTGKHKVTVRYFPGARTDGRYDCMKPLLGNYWITSFCKLEQMMLLIIHQGKS